MGRTHILLLTALALAGAGACTSPQSRREASLRRAQEAATSGDLERAAATLRTALGFDPRDRQVAARLAEVYEDSRAYPRALRLLESFPGEVQEPAWRNLRARLLLRCGRVREGGLLAASLARQGSAAEETFQVLSDVVVQRKLGPRVVGDATDAWAHRLAGSLLDAGEVGTAVSWLEELPPLGNPEEDALVSELFELALASDDRRLVRRIGSLAGEAETPLALLVRRRGLLLEGKTAEIVRLDRRFLASFPDDPRRGDLLESAARRHLARGDLKEALDRADQALALDGSRVGALIVRGLALEWSGRSEEGHAALRTALALEPDNRMAREALRATHGGNPLIMRLEALEP